MACQHVHMSFTFALTAPAFVFFQPEVHFVSMCECLGAGYKTSQQEISFVNVALSWSSKCGTKTTSKHHLDCVVTHSMIGAPLSQQSDR
jgi:hypothetical protein